MKAMTPKRGRRHLLILSKLVKIPRTSNQLRCLILYDKDFSNAFVLMQLFFLMKTLTGYKHIDKWMIIFLIFYLCSFQIKRRSAIHHQQLYHRFRFSTTRDTLVFLLPLPMDSGFRFAYQRIPFRPCIVKHRPWAPRIPPTPCLPAYSKERGHHWKLTTTPASRVSGLKQNFIMILWENCKFIQIL